MSSPLVTIPNDGVLTPIPEEIPQSPVLSLAAPSEDSESTVPTLNLLDSKEQYDDTSGKPVHIPIPTVTFLLDYPPSQQQHIILPLSDTYQVSASDLKAAGYW